MPLARPLDSGGKRSAKRDPHIGLEEERVKTPTEGIEPANCLAGCDEHSAEDQVPVGGGQTHAKESQREDQGADAKHLMISHQRLGVGLTHQSPRDPASQSV